MDPGSEEDFDELFRREYSAVWRSVVLIVGDREVAQEVCQEAFAAAFSHWAKVSRYERPGAWVRRVAIRHAIRVASRDRKRERVARAVAEDRTSERRTDDAWNSDVHDELVAVLKQLSPNQRAAVVLHHLQDLTVSDVAADLGCSVSTASVHLHRGRSRLAELLEKEADDERR